MIPVKIREYLAKDPFMNDCIHNLLDNSTQCFGRVEWEHAFIYSGKQVNEPWSIVPCCTYHHRGNGLVKEFNRFVGLSRGLEMMPKIKERYPKKNWEQEYNYLNKTYGWRCIKEIKKVSEVQENV